MISARYSAFISYRHQSPDQEIASRLHRMIETYTIPSALRKNGIRHPGKVFRDQEELPLSADLGHDIETALDNSEWLICICSPRYLESRWCLREVEYFIEHKSRDRVLTVLVEGEPEDSFPELLLYETDEAGNRKEREPLAANVRGAGLAENLKKLKKERYRILAPIIGTTFDGLYQRQRRRVLRNVLTAALATVVILGSFLAYALIQNVRIEEERTAAARNECDLLVEKSVYYSSVNRKSEATRLALEAKTVSETVDGYAKEPIREALAVSCSMGDFSVAAELDFPGLVNHDPSCFFSPDGTKIAVLDSRSALTLCDASTGERLWVSPPFSHDISSVHWNAESTQLVVTVQWGHTVCLIDAGTGEHRKEISISWPVNAVFEGKNVLIAFAQGLVRWEPDVSDENFPYVFRIDEDQSIASSAQRNDRFITLSQSFPTPRIFVKEISSELYSCVEMPDNTVIKGYAVSPDGRWIYVHQYSKCFVMDLTTDKILWTADPTRSGMEATECTPIWVGDVILDCGAARSTMTGEVLYTTKNSAAGVTPDEQYFYDATAFYRVSDGSWFADVPGDLKAVSPAGDRLVVYYTTEYGRGLPGNPDMIASRNKKAYLELSPGNGSQYTLDRYEGVILEIPANTAPKSGDEGKAIALNDPYGTVTTGYIMSRNFFSPDSRYCVILNLGGYIPVYDLEKSNEPIARIYDFSVGDHVEAIDLGFSADSRYAAIAGAAGQVAVYELETGRMVRSFTDTYLSRSLSGLKFNRDGLYLMVSDYDRSSFHIYSVAGGQTMYVMHAAQEVASWGFDEATGDAVLCYTDGSALLARMFDDEEALYSYARQKAE
jgi:WD40 repeat protein